MSDQPIKVRDVATPAEMAQHARLLRLSAWWRLAMFPLVLLVLLVLAPLRWLGERADAAWEWVDSPRYRWDNQADDILRKWVRRARRLRDPTCCNVPPRGWRCTRDAGHDGPCAAVPE